MELREWALVLFTVLMQMSVGAFVVLGVVHFYAMRKAGAEQADRLSDLALFAIGPTVVLALIASLGHLGNPFNAPRAIMNLRTSWLSREIFLSMGFVVVGAVFAFMQWRKIGSFALRNVVAWVAALVGLAAVYSMARVYMLRTVPVWDTPATPFSFFTTTFLLGALAIGAALAANYSIQQRRTPGCAEAQCTLLRDTVRWIALAVIVLLGLEFVIIPLYTATLVANPATAEAGRMLGEEYNLIYMLRLVLVFLGAGLGGLFLYRTAQSAGRERMLTTVMFAAFALVFASELLGRYMFYATYMRVGL